MIANNISLRITLTQFVLVEVNENVI